MNAFRRKEIKKAIDLLLEARELLGGVVIDEQDSFDNLPEGFQEGEKGERMEENISELDGAINDIENLEEKLLEF